MHMKKNTSKKQPHQNKARPKNKNYPSQKKNAPKTQQVEGILRISLSGTGRILTDDKNLDIKVESGFLGTGLNGDVVLATIIRALQKDAPIVARVKKIITRKKMEYVGTLENEKEGIVYMKAQDPRVYTHIIISKEKMGQAKVGQKVLAKIVRWKDSRDLPEGEVLEVIGTPNEHETEMLAVLRDRGIQTGFSPKVEAEARFLEKQKQTILNEALNVRRDAREIPTFTIDPEDAKDFDDALSFRTLPNGNVEIGIHIADASHFVTKGSELDKEARRRGTSVYMVDRTVPMLPEILSNDLCSLNANEDKLTFSVFFIFSKESVEEGGNFLIESYTVEKTVTRSDKRFSYEEAQRILDAGNGTFFNELKGLNNLAKKLAKQNTDEGALSFSQEEVKFILDENKKIIDVRIKKMGETNSLIEQFMLLANKTVTEYVHKKIPEKERLFLYRIHDKPDKDRILELIELLRSLGYKLRMKDDTISSEDLNRILASSVDTPEANMIQMATIRSMAKAIYSIQNIGHFGLAFENYTHFTSPIRRYPDIIVHRLVKDYQDGKRVPRSEWESYQTLAQDLSDKERNAMEAERGSIRYKQIEYLQERADETFDGIITSITEWGIYVEESKTKAEGLIRIRDLNDDYYIYEKSKMALIGSKTKKTYKLGDPMRVKIKKIDNESRVIDYKLAD